MDLIDSTGMWTCVRILELGEIKTSDWTTRWNSFGRPALVKVVYVCLEGQHWNVWSVDYGERVRERWTLLGQ